MTKDEFKIALLGFLSDDELDFVYAILYSHDHVPEFKTPEEALEWFNGPSGASEGGQP